MWKTQDTVISTSTPSLWPKGGLGGWGGIFMVETIFDTLNAKAALYAIMELLDSLPEEDRPGLLIPARSRCERLDQVRQTTEAFWASVRYPNLLSVDSTVPREPTCGPQSRTCLGSRMYR